MLVCRKRNLLRRLRRHHGQRCAGQLHHRRDEGGRRLEILSQAWVHRRQERAIKTVEGREHCVSNATSNEKLVLTRS